MHLLDYSPLLRHNNVLQKHNIIDDSVNVFIDDNTTTKINLFTNISHQIHDAKKAREQNLSLSKQKNMKKKRQESVRNWVAKCRALKKARVNNNASWQRQQQKQRRLWISHSHQL